MINVIHDNRMSERYLPLIKELEAQGVGYIIWQPIESVESVVKSINLSHKQIVKWAMENGMKEVCIAEDDLMFTCINAWEYFLENKPIEYDIYSSCTYDDDLKNHNHLCGFHLYFVNERFYEKYLSVPDEAHVDTAIDEMGGNFVVCRPFIALQRPFRSANHPEIPISNYNTILKEGDIYKG